MRKPMIPAQPQAKGGKKKLKTEFETFDELATSFVGCAKVCH
jgi:hypothetical protein